MDVLTAIKERRSIRKYDTTSISHDDIERIILAGMQAPSGKNRQPWRFIVVEGVSKIDMLKAMNRGLERETHNPKLPNSAKYIDSVKHTISIMEQAPVTIFIINPLNSMECFPEDWESRFYEVCNIQSIGACIQNMLLVAVDLGVGSLWNNDIYFAYDELAGWLNTREQIVAAVSFGISSECPNARPRNNIADLVKWSI